MAGGRPSKYDLIINKTSLQLIRYWVIKGCTEQEIANKLEIHIDTLIEWKKVKKEFSEALKAERGSADDMVEGSLFKKALAGDTTACIFWLKNRRVKEWRDKQDIEHSGDININIVKVKK
jgi:transposase